MTLYLAYQQAWFPVFAAALGLSVGSFLNVLIHRIPAGRSIAWPGSHCPHCGEPIPGMFNVPVVSWLVLRGRCRSCHTPISARYLLVEVMVGALFVWLYYRIDRPDLWIASAFMASAVVALIVIDWETMLLPDAITLTAGPVALLATAGGVSMTTLELALPSALVAAGGFWLLGWVFWKLRGVEGLGFGDVKLLLLVGFFSGPYGLLWTIMLGSLAGSVIGISYLAISGKGRATRIPFGPFLGGAFLVYLLYARELNYLFGIDTRM